MSIVDRETGEILDFPPDATTEREQLDWLTHQIIECRRQADLWENRRKFLAHVAGDILDGAGLEGWQSEYGTLSRRSRTNRSVDMDALAQACGEIEVPLDSVIVRTVKALDPDKVTAILYAEDYPGIPRVVTENTTSWIEARQNRKAL
jgi:hypothetical protein